MITLAFAWPVAAATGFLDRIETRVMEVDERSWARTAEPTKPVAPVRIMWTMAFGYVVLVQVVIADEETCCCRDTPDVISWEGNTVTWRVHLDACRSTL
jgi:hypothetical protein